MGKWPGADFPLASSSCACRRCHSLGPEEPYLGQALSEPALIVGWNCAQSVRKGSALVMKRARSAWDRETRVPGAPGVTVGVVYWPERPLL